MKRWWIGYTGPDETVQEVEVIGQRNPEASWGMSVARLADGTIDDVRTSDLHGTESEARRGRALSEAEDLEDQAKDRDGSAEHAQDRADEALANVARYKGEAAALRARAKALLDALEEVKDATEGRR